MAKRSFPAVDMSFSDKEFDDIFRALRHYGRELRVFLSDADEGDDVDRVRRELTRIETLISRFADVDECGGK